VTVTTADWIPKPPELGWWRRQLLRFTGPLLTLLVASLFALSFWESWAALAKAATRAEIPHPHPWPWAVDGFILVTAIMVAHAKLLDRRNAKGHVRGLWAPRVLLVCATALSTAIQWGYAPRDPWLHAWSPVAVLLSFECLIRLLYGAAVGAVGGQRDQEVRGGPPGETAEGVPVGTAKPSRLAGGTPPPSTVPVSVDGGHGPDTGAPNLPDPPATVTTPTVTVPSRSVATPWRPHDPAVDEALRRRKKDRERLVAYATDKGLPVEEVLAMAARRGWPAANGHRRQVSA
jgi:hypothetical protein